MDLSLFPISLFNHYFISLWPHGYLFHALGYNPMLLNFLALLVPALATGSSCSWLLCPYDTSTFFFLSTPLFSGATRCSKLILYISCSSPRICYFSKQPWFLSLENGVRNQDLGIRCAHSYGDGIASRSCQLKEQGNICVYTNLCIYTYL